MVKQSPRKQKFGVERPAAEQVCFSAMLQEVRTLFTYLTKQEMSDVHLRMTRADLFSSSWARDMVNPSSMWPSSISIAWYVNRLLVHWFSVTEAVGDGRLRLQCSHVANWTKHTRRLLGLSLSCIKWHRPIGRPTTWVVAPQPQVVQITCRPTFYSKKTCFLHISRVFAPYLRCPK